MSSTPSGAQAVKGDAHSVALSRKATIDLDEALYRRLKVEAARRGRTVRDLVADGVRHVLGLPPPSDAGAAVGPWFGSLRDHAANAGGAHDLETIRESIARGREVRRG